MMRVRGKERPHPQLDRDASDSDGDCLGRRGSEARERKHWLFSDSCPVFNFVTPTHLSPPLYSPHCIPSYFQFWGKFSGRAHKCVVRLKCCSSVSPPFFFFSSFFFFFFFPTTTMDPMQAQGRTLAAYLLTHSHLQYRGKGLLLLQKEKGLWKGLRQQEDSLGPQPWTY